MAALTRATKLPKLETLLREEPSERERAPQSPDEIRRGVLSWAAAAGLKVEYHDSPVI